MTEDEALATYNELMTILDQVRGDADPKLDGDFWLQVRSEVRAGRPVRRSLKGPSERSPVDPLGADKSSSGSKADFIGREDFSSKEKLAFLASSIQLALVSPQMMFQHVIALVENSTSVSTADVTLNFTRDVSEGADRTIASMASEMSRPICDDINSLMNEILVELGYPPSTENVIEGDDFAIKSSE